MTGRSTTTLAGFEHLWQPASDPHARVLLLLHGTGGDEHDLLPLGRLLDPAAALLSPRGQVLEHGAPRFFRRLAEGVFDLQDLALRTHALADFVVEAARSYGFEPARVVAVGFSNGANIAASVLLVRPEVLGAAVLFSPMLPYEPDPGHALAGLPVLITAGRHDPIAPADQAERLAGVLRARGATVEVQWTGGGHGITQDQVTRARQWLAGVDAPGSAR